VVTPHFTTVLSVLHKDFTVSVEIKEIHERGSIEWDGRNPAIAIMREVPMHIRIQKGEHVVISAYSDLFPQGTAVGVIEDFEVKQGDAFYTIYVKLAEDIRNINTAYVVKNLMKAEKEQAESTNKE
jgi:rod shape-determining protein MreC